MILNPFQTPYLIPIKLQTTYFHGNHRSIRICYWLHPSFHLLCSTPPTQAQEADVEELANYLLEIGRARGLDAVIE